MKTEFTPEQLADPATAASEKAIRACVHCGFCLATCPTYVLLGDERDSPRGRIYLAKEMLERNAQPTAEIVTHIDRCLSCLACTTTCPSGVDYMHLIDHARAYIEKRYKRPLLDRALRWVLARTLPHRARFAVAVSAGRIAAPLAGAFAAFPGGDRLAAMLRLAKANRAFKPNLVSSAAAAERKGRVLLMAGCAEPVLRPDFQAAAARLLNRLGYDVQRAPDEGCCGGLVHHMGREAEALGFAKRQIDAWTPHLDELDAIIVTASGCGVTIKDYGFILRNDSDYAARAARVSSLAKDIAEFIPAGALPAAQPMKIRVAYHAACSLQHGQKLTAQPRRLLERAGFEVVTPAEGHLCCGSAGTYNILQPAIARQLGERKTATLEALKPDAIATGNIGCAVQIAAFTGIPIVHTAELLDWATGGPRPKAMGSA